MISVTHHAVLAAFSLALLLNSTGYADESCDCAATSEGSADGSGSGSGVAVLQPKAAVAPARSVSEGAVVSPLLSIAAGTAASSEFSAGLEVRFSTGPEVEFSFAPTVQANTTNGVRELLSIRAGDVNVSSGVGGGVAFTLFGLRTGGSTTNTRGQEASKENGYERWILSFGGQSSANRFEFLRSPRPGDDGNALPSSPRSVSRPSGLVDGYMAAVTDGDSLVGIFEAYGRVELGHRGASTSVEYCVPGPNVQLDESSDAVVPSETCATRANGAPVRTRETVVGLGLALADPQERWRAGVDLRVLPSVTDGNGAPVEFEIGAPILGNFARIRSGDKSYKGILALVPFARFATAEDEPSPFFGLRLEVRGDTTLLGRALSPIR